MHSLKMRILTPLSLTLAILCLGFVFSAYWNHDKYLTDSVNRKIESVENLFAAQLDNDSQIMGVGLEMLLRDQQLLKAFKVKDRQALRTIALPLLKQLQSKYQINHVYFTGPDRVNILRVHKPREHSDKIDHFTTLTSAQSEKIAYGIEMGPLGTLTLRVVAPWYEGNQLIGYVEFGADTEHIINKLNRILGVEIYVFIEKEFLNRKNWESGMHRLNRKAAWDQFPSVVMVDQTMQALPEGLIALLDQAHPSFMGIAAKWSLNERRFFTRFINLKESSGRKVGKMLINYDITDMVADFHTTLLLAGTICLMAGGILWVMFYRILGRVESPMVKPSGTIIDMQNPKRKTLENKLATTQRMENIGLLAAGIAHEINTPIQYIGDNTQFFRESFDDMCAILQKYNRLLKAIETGDPTQDIIEDILAAIKSADLEYLTEEIPTAIKQTMEGVDHVAKIALSMKEFAHPGVDEMTEIDINKALESTIVVSRNEWKYVTEIEKDFDPAMPLVSCFPGELNQAFLNILINATHAIAEVVGDGSKGKGIIKISTKSMGDSVEIRISDTGPGIPEDIRKKIFDPFFTTKAVGKGTGQGLALAYSTIVVKHRASLNVETETGKGTTFVIRMPIEKGTSQ